MSPELVKQCFHLHVSMQYGPRQHLPTQALKSRIAVHHRQQMALADYGLTMEFGV